LFFFLFSFTIKISEKPIIAKIAILGDSNVGKTALLIRYAEDRFEENTPATIENDYKLKELDYHGTKMKLQIWFVIL
jgi:small GTP-binding protein